MKIKKITATAMAAAMALTFVSCDSNKENDKETEKATEAVTEAVTEAATEAVTEEATEAETEADEISEDDANAAIGDMFGSTADVNEFISTTDINPPLWKVTDSASGNSMYLLGTIHMLPAEIEEYPQSLLDIYESCDSIAVEYDISLITTDANAQLEYVNGLIYSDGSTITDHISEETYTKAKDYFTSIGAYSEMLNQYKAGYWINQLSSINLLRLKNMQLEGTDAHFIAMAQEDGKEILNIEDLAIQTNALTGMSDELADYIIDDAVDEMDDIDAFAQEYADLYNVWAVGSDEFELDSDVDLEELPEDLKDDYDAYYAIMYNNRNEYMAEKASQFLKEGKNCLYMVGAAHYAGENGVDNLLEGMGYTVEKVS